MDEEKRVCMKIFQIFKAFRFFGKKQVKELNYKEKSYKCDTCKFRTNDNTIEVTICDDIARHYVPIMGMNCEKCEEKYEENKNG